MTDKAEDAHWAAIDASADALVDREAARLRRQDAQYRRERATALLRRIATATRLFGGHP